jgi:hypothetical protein
MEEKARLYEKPAHKIQKVPRGTFCINTVSRKYFWYEMVTRGTFRETFLGWAGAAESTA